MTKALIFVISFSSIFFALGESNHSVQYKVKGVEIFLEIGGRVDWCETNNMIAFDRKGEDGLYDIYIIRPDHSDEKCITDIQGLPERKHIGQPAWHPSGRYIVCQVENEYSKGSINNQPSMGLENDLYLIDLKEKVAYQLTNNPEGFAALHPKFSHNGKKLLWAESYAKGRGSRWGHWRLKLADIIIDSNEVHFENTKNLEPGGKRWYESHGFSPEDKFIYFSGNLHGGWGNDIFICDTNGNNLTALTDEKDIWDEMAELSPDGKKIAFISSRFFKWKKRLGFLTLKTEIFLMDRDGTNIEQITHLNDDEHSYLVGDMAWSPDGKTLLATAYERNSKRTIILRIDFADK